MKYPTKKPFKQNYIISRLHFIMTSNMSHTSQEKYFFKLNLFSLLIYLLKNKEQMYPDIIF